MILWLEAWVALALAEYLFLRLHVAFIGLPGAGWDDEGCLYQFRI